MVVLGVHWSNGCQQERHKAQSVNCLQELLATRKIVFLSMGGLSYHATVRGHRGFVLRMQRRREMSSRDADHEGSTHWRTMGETLRQFGKIILVIRILA